MWVGENNERPVVAHRSRSVRRVMYTLFFDSDGIVTRVSVPENCRVTGTFYRKVFVLSAVDNHYQTKRPRAGVRGIKLLHDIAPAHRSGGLIWRNFIFRSCHTHSTALTSLPVISGLTHISNLAYEDVNLRRAVLWAVRCTSV